MHTEEVRKLGNIIGAEWSVSNFFAAGSGHNGMEFVVFPNAVDDQPSPVDGHGVGGRPTADNPERRLVGKIPTDDSALIRVAPAELCGKIRFQAKHLGVGVRMASMPPRHVPIRFADLAADKQAGMKINLILVSEHDQVVKLLKGHRIVIPGTWLEPGPHHVEAEDGVNEFVHLGKIGFDVFRIPLYWPRHCRVALYSV